MMNISEEDQAVSQTGSSLKIIRLFISEAAYYKAERRGFAPGFEEQDWLEAEQEIKKEFKNYLIGHYDFLNMR
ncbi:MAG: DUF2934 domain-containing protein [Gammaproteobacteria bacterium]